MQAVQFSKPGGNFELVERPTPQPGRGEVRIATAPNSKSMSSLSDGIAPNGTLIVVGAAMESLTISSVQLIRGRCAIQSWASGTGRDSEDTLAFSAQNGVR